MISFATNGTALFFKSGGQNLITREQIIPELGKKYPDYEFSLSEITKNGHVKMNAIAIKNSTRLSPQIYTDGILENAASLNDAVDKICHVIDNNLNPSIDIDLITSPDFIKTHLRIGIQESSDELIVKRLVKEYPGIEQYLYYLGKADDGTSWSVKIRPDLFATLGIPETLAWELAFKHTHEAVSITSMYDLLREVYPTELLFDLSETQDIEMYILTNKERLRGAASILDFDFLKSFAESKKCKSIAILPSSIHECILIPVREGTDTSGFNEMVRDVNTTELAPEDVLVNRAYVLNF